LGKKEEKLAPWEGKPDQRRLKHTSGSLISAIAFWAPGGCVLGPLASDTFSDTRDPRRLQRFCLGGIAFLSFG
jgi:hypothetical protein